MRDDAGSEDWREEGAGQTQEAGRVSRAWVLTDCGSGRRVVTQSAEPLSSAGQGTGEGEAGRSRSTRRVVSDVPRVRCTGLLWGVELQACG